MEAERVGGASPARAVLAAWCGDRPAVGLVGLSSMPMRGRSSGPCRGRRGGWAGSAASPAVRGSTLAVTALVWVDTAISVLEAVESAPRKCASQVKCSPDLLWNRHDRQPVADGTGAGHEVLRRAAGQGRMTRAAQACSGLQSAVASDPDC
jgi:hypothetical protein